MDIPPSNETPKLDNEASAKPKPAGLISFFQYAAQGAVFGWIIVNVVAKFSGMETSEDVDKYAAGIGALVAVSLAHFLKWGDVKLWS